MLRRAIAVAVAILTVSALGPAAQASHKADAEVVIEWNQLLQATLPPVGIAVTRYLAMMHIAMFDAANAIEQEFTQYLVQGKAPGGASPTLAAAAAAHGVLSSLIPGQRQAYDAALGQRLAGVAPGVAHLSVAIGHYVAARVLEWRENDGWSAPPPPYEPPPFPGLWQRTPPGAPASFTQVPGVRPFALPTATIFLPPPPPALTSARYAQDFNEVKTLGSSTSTVRTPEQTLRSRLFAGTVTSTSLFAMWNNVTRDRARAERLSLAATARLFARVNVSIHDSLLSTMSGKFVYGLWRPVTAIRRADEDLNDDTVADPSWLPLITTPTYPAYPGNQAGVAASAATALRLAIGSDTAPVTVTWIGIPPQADVSRTFDTLWALAEAQAISRLHAGIHFTFDNQAGQAVAVRVAQYVADHYMLPRSHGRD